MSTVDAFVSSLRADGLRLTLDGDRLRYTSARGPLEPEKLNELKKRRDEIILFLRLQDTMNTPVISIAPRLSEIPLSLLQEACLEADLINVTRSLRLRGTFNLAAFERAMNELVRRHEILRTNIVVSNCCPVQIVLPLRNVEFQLVDLTELTASRKLEEAMVLSADFKSKRFDIAADVPIRAQFIKISNDDHILTLSVCHLMADHVSFDTIWAEVSYLYNAYRGGSLSSLPEPSLQFGDYAVWERKQFPHDILREIRSYWDKLLRAPPINRLSPAVRARQSQEIRTLATFSSRPEGNIGSPGLSTDGMSQEHVFLIPAQPIRSLANKQGTSDLVVILSAFKLLLSTWTGDEDITVSSPISFRVRGELSKLIGFLLAVRHLRTKVSADASIRQLISDVQNTINHALSCRQICYFQAPRIMFTYVPRNPGGKQRSVAAEKKPMTDEPPLDIQPAWGQVMVNAEKALYCIVAETEEEFNIRIMFHLRNFSTAMIGRLCDHFRALLLSYPTMLDTKIFRHIDECQFIE